MNTNHIAQNAKTMAIQTGKRLAAFIEKEVKNSDEAWDTRIDDNIIRASVAQSADLLRPDVPRHAYLPDGTQVPLPHSLNDQHNHLIKDRQGKLLARKMLISDFNQVCTSPSPAQPIADVRQVWPVLAMVYLMTTAYIHWTFGLAVLLTYALLARPTDQSGFFSNLWYIVMGTSAKTMFFVAPIVLYLIFTAGWLASAFLPVFMWLKAYSWLWNRNRHADTKARQTALDGQATHFTQTGFLTQTDHEDKLHVASRQEQANAVAADKAPSMDINATATGFFTARGSLNSPDEGKNMTFTGTDLGPGILAFGSSGKGKTYTFMEPILAEVDRVNRAATDPSLRYGVFLMDAKPDLPPKGAAIFENFRLITPKDYVDPKTGVLTKASLFAPMEGLNAEQVTKLIGDIFATVGNIWDNASEEFFMNLAIAMECAKAMGLKKIPVSDKDSKTTGEIFDVKWNLETLFRLAISDVQTTSMLRAIASTDEREKRYNRPSPVAKHPLMAKSFSYFIDNYKQLADNTRSSLKFTISSWIADSVNREITPWMEAETGVRVEDVYKGESMGFLCPEAEYGKSAVLMLAMVRARLYNFAKKRSSNWEPGGTRAMVIVDEFALLIGKGVMELGMAPIQRSLGLCMVLATQTIEQVWSVMGKEDAETLLDNYTKNVVCFSSSAHTYEYLNKKMGTMRALVPSSRSKEAPVGLDVYGTLLAQELAGGNVGYYDQERLENKQTKAPTTVFDKGLLPNFKAIVSGTDANKLYKNIRDEDAPIRYIDGGKLSMEEADIFDPKELSRLLSFKFHAFLCLDIGGVRRYDLVHLGPKNKPKALKAA